MNEINRKVAIALGYTIKLLEDYDHTHGDDYHVAFIAPDGNTVHAAWYGSPDNIEHVIDHMYMLGKLPNWKHDTNDAMSLLKSTGENWQIDYVYEYGIEHRSGYSVSIDGDAYVEITDGDLPGLICEAWLQWEGVSDE